MEATSKDLTPNHLVLAFKIVKFTSAETVLLATSLWNLQCWPWSVWIQTSSGWGVASALSVALGVPLWFRCRPHRPDWLRGTMNVWYLCAVGALLLPYLVGICQGWDELTTISMIARMAYTPQQEPQHFPSVITCIFEVASPPFFALVSVLTGLSGTKSVCRILVQHASRRWCRIHTGYFDVFVKQLWIQKPLRTQLLSVLTWSSLNPHTFVDLLVICGDSMKETCLQKLYHFCLSQKSSTSMRTKMPLFGKWV